MAFNLGALAPLAGIGQGLNNATDFWSRLQSIRQQKARMQDQEAQRQVLRNLPAIASQLPDPSTQQQYMPLPGSASNAGMTPDQPQQPPMMGPLPQLSGASGPPSSASAGGVPPQTGPQQARGSWFGNYQGANRWQDPTSNKLQASGLPTSTPGIALPNRGTLGQQFDVRFPNGRTMQLPQTDIGPAKWTGRGIDINAAAAERAGYSPKNFPTDALIAFQQASPQQHQQSNQVAQGVLYQTPPAMRGSYTLPQLAKIVQQASPPDTSDEVKGLTLIKLQQMLAPDAKAMFEAQIAQQRFGIEEERTQAMLQRGQTQAAEAESGREQRAEQFETNLAEKQREFEAKQAGTGAQKFEASKSIEILDKDGNVTRTVLARESRDRAGWVDSATGQPLTLKPGETMREITPSSGGGGRAGAQVLRQEIGGREVLSDLQNATSMPVGSTTGMLGGYQPGTSLTGALHGDLARQLTSQDAQLMQASMASLTRELSILMSPVYGGNYAAQQIEPLVPKAGDTVGTTLFKMARIAQSADNALEAVSKSPVLSGEQKAFAVDLRKQIQEAVPWTTAQAMEFSRQGKGGQSFKDFAKLHVSGQGEGAAPPIVGAPPATPQGVIRLDENGNEIK